jgi:dienelactone hydrolase
MTPRCALRRLLAASVVACAAFGAPDPAAGADAEQRYVGAFRFQRDWIYMSVQVSSDAAGRAAVKARFPLHQMSSTADVVKLSADRLMFELPTPRGSLRFEGRVGGGDVEGRVLMSGQFGEFRLLQVVPDPAEGFNELVGDYELGPGELVLLMQLSQGPGFVSWRDGRIGLLQRRPGGELIAGSSMHAAYPIAISVEVIRGPDGAPSALRWTEAGKPPRIARKVTLYAHEPVSIVSGAERLGGSLYMPPGPGPHPAVIVLPGSAPAPRTAYLYYADFYARHGVATLLLDKRGIGTSTGSWSRATFDDLAGDALAAVAFLKSRPQIDPDQVGLHGVSMGGWVAPLAASRSSDVRFLVLEGAPAVSPAVHERGRVAREMRADGASPAAVAHALRYMDLKFEAARTGEGWERLEAARSLGDKEGWTRYVNPPSSLEHLRWSWPHVLSYDPAPAPSRVRAPTLALYGERDAVTSPGENAERLAELLGRGGADVSVVIVPAANHGFLLAATGGPGESPRLSRFAPEYFRARLEWLANRPDAAVALRAPTSGAAPAAGATAAPALESDDTSVREAIRRSMSWRRQSR